MVDYDKLRLKILNESNLREMLRKKVPEINGLEKLDSLRQLTLTHFGCGLDFDLDFELWYKGIGTNGLFPDIKKNLIRYGLVKEQDVLEYLKGDESDSTQRIDAFEEIRFTINKSIQVNLIVYHPEYKPSRIK